MKVFPHVLKLCCALLLFCALGQSLHAYSVLTHEALIDAAWASHVRPALLRKYPQATPDELREARAYLYGGAIIQDLGYYPFGNKFFSDLTHYVRGGDFVIALLDEAQNLNEYAFALGALEHYAGDNNGHPIAVNPAVALVYPKLQAKYGKVVSYENDPTAHVRMEFGFDVLQVAKGRYLPQAYHDFIGFKVSKPVLERAFQKTYSIELKDVFASVDLALGTYRRSVSSIIPQLTKVAWAMKRAEIEKLTPGITREKFVYQLSRADYEKEWGREYQKPGFFAKTFALFLRIVPKVGPFKALAFRPPSHEAEKLFIASFDASLNQYQELLEQERMGKLELPNRNLDTGLPLKAGSYHLADETYAKLVHKLADNKFEGLNSALRANILAYFGEGNVSPSLSRKDKWQVTQRELKMLEDANKVGQKNALMN
ncbi:MAG TPA: zinc dependent phospholipase C family protein [Blastocatellia bacterium]|nr:zinc dependent phospholipase C family protein [Blastocatellia bacterium]